MACRFLTGSYAGTSQKAICLFSFSPAAGFFMETGWTGFLNPSYIIKHPTLPIFYCVEETAPLGRIHAVLIAGTRAEILDTVSSGGADPCHLSLSGDAKRLYASNYTDGSLSFFHIDDQGRIISPAFSVRHTGHGADPVRQEQAHVHFSMDTGSSLFVCDLGLDTIFLYSIFGTQLRTFDRIRMPPGSGPRHLASSGKCLYCISELNCRVYVLIQTAGTWKIAQVIPLLHGNQHRNCTGAAIHIAEKGDLLFVSTRGNNSLAVFQIFSDGSLSDPVLSPCIPLPRDFLISDHYVIVGSQSESLISAYSLDPVTLRLTETGYTASVDSPVCFCRL